MENQCLAVPFVPAQTWDLLYDPATALAEGTVFPGLNKPFFAAPEGCNTTLPAAADDPQILFSQYCFVLDDLLLYLDTHPQDEQAKACYQSFLVKKKELQKSASCGCCMTDHFEWDKKPLVWEGGHC